MAPPYVVEFAQIKITDAFKSSPDVVQGILEFLKNAEGTKKIYSGVEVQDPSIWWLAIEWETLQDHLNLINDKEQYSILTGKIQKINSSVKLFHVNFTEAPYSAFDAPYTELVFWTLKSGHTTHDKKERSLEILRGIVTTFNGLSSDAGVFQGTIGPVVEEEENAISLTLGWTSPEATRKAVESLPEAKVLIGELQEIANLRLVHVPLSNAK